MCRHARWFAVTTLCFGVGAILGPVLIAAAAAALGQEPDDYGSASEAALLVDAYRDQLPRGHLFLSLAAPPDGEECGYNPDIIFPERIRLERSDGSSGTYSDHRGYAALNGWRSQTRDEAWIAAITASIQERMSSFQIGFLRRCMESTLFAGLCASEVEQFGDIVPRFRRPAANEAQGFEDRVVCTFVDGVAARRGVALSRWPGAH